MMHDRLVSAEGPMPTRSAYLRQRAFECIPTVLLLLTIFFPLLLWALSVELAFVVLCGYLIYLAVLSIDMAIRQVTELQRMRNAKRVDWQARLNSLLSPYQRLDELNRLAGLTRRDKDERSGLLSRVSDQEAPDPRKLWHLVVVPIASEDSEVIRPTLDALLCANYPPDRLAVCLSFEARCRIWTDDAIDALLTPYEARFGMLLRLRHPDGLPGEAQVKGANISWATKRARKALHAAGVADVDVVVSAFDCDTRASADYFSVLAWTYLTDPKRHVNCYQPILLFHNNVWEVPAVSRLVGYLATMWNMGDATRRGKTQIFASHAIGMEALVCVDFWATNVVPDDSRQHWRLYYGTDGQSITQPLHVPLYLDAVQHHGFVKTLIEQYLQIRRWSYGVSDFPYIMKQNFANSRILLRRRGLQTVRQLSSFHKRAATPILLLVAGQIIGQIEKGNVPNVSILTATANLIQSWAAAAWLVSMIVAMVISLILLPERPRHRSPLIYLKLGAEWLLVPVVLPVFFSLPTLEVYLRLPLRRYLGFRVTVKSRVAPASTPSPMTSQESEDPALVIDSNLLPDRQ